jgi:TolB-like protein/serine/threonine protein kinase/Tfp pilus assembly protein PilF
MIGRTLAHYRIDAAIGAGGMGEVFRATDTRLGREVALKVLSEEFASDPNRLDRFEREARAVAALNHPHIVTIHSVEEEGGVRFLTMELIEGRSLDKLIPEGGLELAPFFELATPLAEAISAAHDKSVIHRDLKPSNVMVDGDGRVKVLDFGLAKLQQPEGVSDSTELPTEALTGIGMVVGTVPYMSPEQIEGEIVDHRTDIFSLGVLLYEMAIGERPFQGKSSLALMSSILKDVPKPVVELRSDLPRHLGRIIGRCLEKDRRNRYQTARDVFNELKALQRESSSSIDVAGGASGAVSPNSPSSSPQTHPSGQPLSAPAGVSGVVGQDEGFWVAVLPFKYTGGDADLTALAEGLSEEIVTGLSRFSYLRVIARGSVANDARYLMEGSLRKAGTKLRVAVQLVDAGSGAHLWAETYDRPFSSEDIFALQDELVPRIVSTVADMNGVLPRSMSEAVRSRDPDQMSPYEAVLRSFVYFERVTAEELAAARSALELAVKKAPAYADAWAMLALLCAQEYGQGFNLVADSLASGAAAARRAVETGPSNHLAHFSLAQVLFFQKEFGAFRNAAARAAELNPMDGNSIAFLGELLTYAGDFERGLALADRAKQLNPNHPGWYWYADCLHLYRERDYPAALAVAQKANLPDHWGQNVATAVACGQLGDREAAGKAAKRLLEIRPDFADIARQEFGKWWDPEFVEHMIGGLRKAGLDIPPAPGSEVSSAEADESPGPASGAARSDEGFWIAVLPFNYRGSDPDVETLADGLADEIVSGLSRFSFLRVIASTSTAKYAGEVAEVGSVGRELGARYVIEGSIRQAGSTLRISAKLVDTDSGANLWAETFERPFHPEAVFELQDDLVPRIVSAVGDAHGILPHTMSELLRGKGPDQLTPYEAVLRSFGYGYRRTPEEHAAVRAALELAVEQAPRYADAWAMLALVYVDEQAHGYNLRPDPLGRALQAARRAAEAAPSNAMAYNALAWATFFRKEFRAFRTAAEQSITLNPLNSPTLAGLGAMTAYSGDWERGCALVERALQLNPRHPGWYWLPLFYNAYRNGDYRDAVNLAHKFNLPDFFVTHEALAAAYGQLGELDEAGQALREMLRLKTDYAATGRERLEKWFDAEFVEHLMDGLQKAGLDIATGVQPKGETPTAETSGPAVSMAPSIAVLPFTNMSADRENDYFSDGLSEEIINALTRLPGLRVIARTSAFRFRGEQDLRKVGETLGVRNVLEGSVRRAGQQLRITAQLVDVADDSHIWSERFDREMTDVFEIQDEIAGAIVNKLHLSLGASEPARRQAANVAAYEALLEARHHFSQFTPMGAERALVCLGRSLSLDPDYPDALVMHAFYHLMMAYMFADPREALPNTRALAERALQLDPYHGEAQAAVAVVAVTLDHDWSASEPLFRRALALAPASARVHELYGLCYLLGKGRQDEALAELDLAIELDPLSALYAGNRGRVLTCSRRFAEAEESCLRGLALDPGQLLTQVELTYALLFGERFEEAIAVGKRAIETHGPVNAPLQALALSHALAGQRDTALQLVNETAAPGAGYRSPLALGLVHAAFSEMDEAFACVERSFEERDPLFMYLAVHPMFDTLRDDPRYPDLLKRMNLAEGDST